MGELQDSTNFITNMMQFVIFLHKKVVVPHRCCVVNQEFQLVNFLSEEKVENFLQCEDLMTRLKPLRNLT